ncbi:MAG: ROK family protein [Clostridiales bacterium]|jgi:glucokinase|nr:ROK family protein [Clostridiales bacterium]
MRIGIDVGGTNIAAGLVNESYEIIARRGVPTNPGSGESGIIRAIIALIKEITRENPGHNIASVGIGVPGQVDPETTRVVYCNNIPFENTKLKESVEAATGLPVFVDNDANAAALGEVLAGAAKDFRDAVLITVGTGVGFGIVLDKKLYKGINGAAGELGHEVIVVDGLPCNCGRRGCLELYASATALKRYTAEEMKKHPESLMWELCQGSADNITGKTAFDAKRANDEAGTRAVDTFIKYLSVGVVNVVNIFQPEAVIIGGGLSKEGEYLLAPLREILERERYSRGGKQTSLITATLGNDAGIIGAAVLNA